MCYAWLAEWNLGRLTACHSEARSAPGCFWFDPLSGSCFTYIIFFWTLLLLLYMNVALITF